VWDSCDKWIDILSVRDAFVFNHFRSFWRVECKL